MMFELPHIYQDKLPDAPDGAPVEIKQMHTNRKEKESKASRKTKK